jgi:hypothetical protein
MNNQLTREVDLHRIKTEQDLSNIDLDIETINKHLHLVDNTKERHTTE